MALIDCLDCGKKVSNEAQSCSGCGRPIARRSETIAAGQSIQTTQKTSKKLKAHLAISGLLTILPSFLFFVVLPIASGQIMNERTVATVVMITAFPFLWFLVTRWRIWWHHE
jgi:uncharacterized membrane protein YvbJ